MADWECILLLSDSQPSKIFCDGKNASDPQIMGLLGHSAESREVLLTADFCSRRLQMGEEAHLSKLLHSRAPYKYLKKYREETMVGNIHNEPTWRKRLINCYASKSLVPFCIL